MNAFRKAGRTTCATQWWIIDYNRQSLDGIVREGLFQRIENTFNAFCWDVIKIKHGAWQQAAFSEDGGDGSTAVRTSSIPR